jgi:hypothetical protein
MHFLKRGELTSVDDACATRIGGLRAAPARAIYRSASNLPNYLVYDSRISAGLQGQRHATVLLDRDPTLTEQQRAWHQSFVVGRREKGGFEGKEGRSAPASACSPVGGCPVAAHHGGLMNQVCR